MPTKKFSIAINNDTVDILQQIAEDEQRSVNFLIVKAVKEFLQNNYEIEK